MQHALYARKYGESVSSNVEKATYAHIALREKENEGGNKKMGKGYIWIKCANCCLNDRVEVYFPAHNKGFDSTEHRCRYCGTTLEVTDPHVYNGDGTIKEGLCNQ